MLQTSIWNVKSRLNKPLVEVVFTDILVESETLAKVGVLKNRVLENDGNVDNATNLYEQICMFEETKNVTVSNMKSYRVSISIGTPAREMHPVNFTSKRVQVQI